MLAPYPRKLAPTSHSDSICLRSPITARVPAPPSGTPLAPSIYIGDGAVYRARLHSQRPPPRNILVPMPISPEMRIVQQRTELSRSERNWHFQCEVSGSHIGVYIVRSADIDRAL
jgi:hypothetical protein